MVKAIFYGISFSEFSRICTWLYRTYGRSFHIKLIYDGTTLTETLTVEAAEKYKNEYMYVIKMIGELLESLE